MQNYRNFWLIALVCSFILIGCNPSSSSSSGAPTSTAVAVSAPLVTLPSTPKYSPTAVELIVNFEVTSKTYYNKHYIFPTWPGGDSGTTVAVGDDLNFKEPEIIKEDYHALSDSDTTRLGTCYEINGIQAKAKAEELHDILISWDIAINEFQDVELNREYQACEKAFPGFDGLRLNAQGVLLSVGYNRGLSMVGSSRSEMRNIRDDVPKKDYADMSYQIRHMERLWPNVQGLINRREAEAALMLVP